MPRVRVVPTSTGGASRIPAEMSPFRGGGGSGGIGGGSTSGSAALGQALGGILSGVVAQQKVAEEEQGRKALGAALLGLAQSQPAALAPMSGSFAPTASGYSPASGTPMLGGTPGGNKTNAQEVYTGLVSRGMPSFLAAGITGNIAKESNFRLSIADNRGEGSVGLIQARGDRLAALKDLGAQSGRDPFSLDNQLDHIVNEANGPEKRAFDIASQAKSPGEAAYLLAKHYERPAAWALRQSAPGRAATAEETFRRFGQQAQADMPAPGAQPVSLDAMGNETGFAVPGDAQAPMPASPMAAAAPTAPTAPIAPADDVGALFSSAPMGPAQSFTLPDAPAPLAMTVQPSASDPGPIAPAPVAAPLDVPVAAPPQQALGQALLNAPLPPARPAGLVPADVPAVGAQEVALPPQRAALAQALAIDPNSNDAGAGIFARGNPLQGLQDGLDRIFGGPQTQARLNGQQTALVGALGGGQPASASPAPALAPPQAGPAPALAPAQAAAAPPADPRQQYAAAIIASPYASDRMKQWAIEQMGPGSVSYHDGGDRIYIQNQRGETVGQLPKAKMQGLTTVAPGSTVFDQYARQPVFSAPARPDPTPDERNYMSARQGGYTGSFNDFLNQKTQRQPQRVEIDNPDGTKRTMMYDPQTNRLVTPEAMGAPAYEPPPRANPYAMQGKGTEDERKAGAFANRMVDAHTITNDLEKLGTQGLDSAVSQLPVVGNMLSPQDRQRYNQAKSQFITAVLRRESGAAIGQQEFDRYDREFFPQPGDKPETVAQKRAARENAIEGFMGGAGNGYTPPPTYKRTAPAPTPGVTPGAASDAGRPPPPAIGFVKNGYEFMGGDPASPSSWKKR